MAENIIVADENKDRRRREPPWFVTVARNRRMVVGSALLLFVLLLALLAHALATHNPLLVRPEIRLSPPAPSTASGRTTLGGTCTAGPSTAPGSR